MDTFIMSFGAMFLVIVACSYLIKVLRQPIILGYVMAGLIFSLYNIDGFSAGEIVLMSELGITFMLFLMGMEFDLKSLKYLGKDILIACVQQSVIFGLIAFLITLPFKFSMIERIYIAILFIFSSTLLVAKWIEDKKEKSALHGKIIMGTLIIQDIFAIVCLTIMDVVTEKSVVKILLAPVGGIVLLILGFVMAKYILNMMLKFIVRYPELLFVFSIGICFFFVMLAPPLGYSTTIGAFIAGITLGNTHYKRDISLKLKPLIVFFNLLFFFGLGYQMKLDIGFSALYLLIALTIATLLLKPAIFYITLRKRGYDLKTSIISGLYLSQISEFGIIIIASAAVGIVSQSIQVLAIIMVIVTMIISSYYIKFDQEIYAFIEKRIIKFDNRIKNADVKGELNSVKKVDAGIVVFGYNELSKELYEKLKSIGKGTIVIENDPENVRFLETENIPYIYNSVSNPDFFDEFSLKNVELVISSYTDVQNNISIVRELKKANPKAVMIATAKSFKDSLTLYDNAADYVICPSYLNEQQVSILVEDYATDINKVLAKKVDDLTKITKLEEQRRKILEKDNLAVDVETFIHRISDKNKGDKKHNKEDKQSKEEKGNKD